MAKPIYDLSKDGLQWAINTDANGKARYGFQKKYASGLTDEAIAQCTLNYDDTWPTNGIDTTKTVTVWSDGTITLDDAASVATATVGANRWADIFPVVVPAWDATSSTFKPKNVAVLLTTDKLYIFDPEVPIALTYLYDYPLATSATPLTVSTGAGYIQAGTYQFVVTEVTVHGVEAPISSAVQVISATDFSQVIAHGPTFANTDAIRWRLYMRRLGAGGDYSPYRFVAEAGIATANITANVDYTALGFVLDSARVQTPATVTVGVVHQGVPVFSGDPDNSARIYVSAVSISESTDITGYADIGNTVAVYESPDGTPVRALASIRDILLVFCDNSIYAFQGTLADESTVIVRTLSTSVGVDSFRKVTSMGENVFFMDTTGTEAWVSDGHNLQQINGENLFAGLWYYLKGNQTINNRDLIQGQFTAELVVPNPNANEVFFGGEIVATAYAAGVEGGTWSASAIAANPQTNRQYVWKVFRVKDQSWTTYTNIPIKAWSNKEGRVYFGDHTHNVYAIRDYEPKDSANGPVLVTKGFADYTGKTITIVGGWGGSADVGAPVSIVNLATGVTQLVYVVSSTGTTITVEKDVTIGANDVLIYGLPVVDMWTEAMMNTADIFSIDLMVSGYIESGKYGVFMSFKDNADLARWFNLWNIEPTSSDLRRYGVARKGRNVVLRLIAPPAYGTGLSLQNAMKHYVHTLRMNGKVFEDATW